MDKTNVVRVYLCGGFHSTWQEQVERGVSSVEHLFQFYNPKEDHDFAYPEEYWPWDLLAIRKSDIVFACFEKWMANRCGAGAISEFGYAVGQGKLVILVNEIDHRYFTQLKHWPNVVYYEKLEEGIRYLRQCRRLI